MIVERCKRCHRPLALCMCFVLLGAEGIAQAKFYGYLQKDSRDVKSGDALSCVRNFLFSGVSTPGITIFTYSPAVSGSLEYWNNHNTNLLMDYPDIPTKSKEFIIFYERPQDVESNYQEEGRVCIQVRKFHDKSQVIKLNPILKKEKSCSKDNFRRIQNEYKHKVQLILKRNQYIKR